jgi:hypothetical protein
MAWNVRDMYEVYRDVEFSVERDALEYLESNDGKTNEGVGVESGITGGITGGGGGGLSEELLEREEGVLVRDGVDYEKMRKKAEEEDDEEGSKGDQKSVDQQSKEDQDDALFLQEGEMEQALSIRKLVEDGWEDLKVVRSLSEFVSKLQTGEVQMPQGVKYDVIFESGSRVSTNRDVKSSNVMSNTVIPPTTDEAEMEVEAQSTKSKATTYNNKKAQQQLSHKLLYDEVLNQPLGKREKLRLLNVKQNQQQNPTLEQKVQSEIDRAERLRRWLPAMRPVYVLRKRSVKSPE